MQRKKLYAILLSASMIAGQGAMPVLAEEILVIDETEDTSVPAEEVVAEDIIITEEEVPAEAQGDVVEEDIIIPETEVIEETEDIFSEVQEKSIEAPADAIAVEEEAVPAEASTGVPQAPQTITGVSDSYSKTYGDEAFSLNALAQTTLSYESLNTSVATVNADGVVSIVGAGTAIIKIFAEETTEYLSDTKEVNVSVDLAFQKIIVPATSYTKATTDSSFNLGASVDSGNTLTYESNDASVVTVDSEGNVTIKGAGTATIKIIAAMIPNYWKSTRTVNVTVKTDVTSKFTDANFKAKVIEALGLSGDNPIIYAEDCTGLTYLNVASSKISDLTGIEYFTGIKQLDCGGNNLSSLDVSKNTALEYLLCENNQLTSLDVSKNTALLGLNCSGNQLTNLDLSKNAALLSLHCSGNQLTSLDLSKCTNLYSLDCSYNYLTPDTLILPGEFTFGSYGTVPQYQKINISATSYVKNIGDAAFDLAANAQTELTFTSSDSAVVEVSPYGMVTPKSVGTATITITAADTTEDGGYFFGTEKTVTVTVKNASVAQTITTSASSYTKTYGDAAFNLGASAKTALSYASSNTAVAAVSSTGSVTIKGSGTATITINAAATSAYKAASKKVTITVKPAAATITKIGPAANGLTITWGKVSSAAGYRIYRSVNGGAYAQINTIFGNATVSYTDTGATTNGAVYKYTVRTFNGNLTGEYSASKSYYRLSLASSFTATNIATRTILVNYSYNPSVTGYQVQWSWDPDFSSYRMRTYPDKNTTSVTIPGSVLGKTYYVRVRSYKTVGSTNYCSPWSAAKSVGIWR